MQDQHKKISGYRDLSQGEIDLMNRIKAFGPELEKLCHDVSEHLKKQYMDTLDPINYPTSEKEQNRIDNAEPEKWLVKGAESLQEGLMFLTRSVAQPTFF